MKQGYLKIYLKIILILIIIVAIIIGSIYVIKNSYTEEKFETLKTDMLLIEGKIKIVSEKVYIKEKDSKYIGTAISEMKDNEKIKSLQENKIINIESKDNNYYVLIKQNLDELGLNELKLSDGSMYIVDYKTNEIIYADGIKDKQGNILYKLSDIEKVK